MEKRQKLLWKKLAAISCICGICLITQKNRVMATVDPADYQIVMIAKQKDPWFEDMETGVEQLKRDTGLNVSMQYPETNDVKGQTEIIKSLMKQGVNAICIVPNDPGKMTDVIQEASNMGIVVVTHEAPSIADKVDLDVEAFVNESFGELFGKNIAEAMNGEGYYAGIVGSRNMDTHMAWYQAAVRYIKENYPNMKCLTEEPQEDGNSLEGAYEATTYLMNNYPQLGGIIECSAYGAGVCNALTERKMSKKVKVVSLAVPSQVTDFLGNGSLISVLAWRPADAGYAVCYAAYLLASGQTVKNGTDLKATGYESVCVKDGIAYGNAPLEYTAENIADYIF